MSRPPSTIGRIAGIAVLCGFAALLIWAFTPPNEDLADGQPAEAERRTGGIPADEQEHRDAELVRQLIREDLGERRFSFPTIILATADRKVVPLDPGLASHRRVTDAIDSVLESATSALGAPDSPIRKQRRINEGSRFFEEALQQGLDALDGISCQVPTNRDGERQRSGYPDLRVVDEASGDVFYLDPKLVEQGAWASSFRSFYFEPKTRTLKINDDAVHLLVGIEHDGNDGEWSFGRWKTVDLSTLKVRLKAEFQASNREMYRSD